MTKKEVKLQIAKLVERYDRILKAGKTKSYNEAQTRNEFIEPFFESLGWDMRNQTTDNEVTTEESVSGGRIDLAFRLNNIPLMFLEAKPLKADLNVESYSRQAINYAWNKGVNYAVLSDFENIKVYNAQAESKSLLDKLIFEISYTEYISDFERLWLLSKESFSRGALDEYAQKYGKMKKSLTVNEKLFGDLKEAREILTKAFRWNEKLTNEELEEGVQRILDRLVFIRVLEDRKLEPPILKEVLRIWERDKSKQFFPLLAHKFRELDDLYNSSLFKEHACEHWEEYDQDTFKKVIRLLYGREDIYAYDFKQIPSDILGGVYESYLSYIAQSKKIDKKEVKVKSRQKRKEQGIFYTPRYIVDFIVKNTLEEKLKECQSITELKKVKVLDPACGSASFLVKALEAINNKYKEFGRRGNQLTKSEILLSNIYGVDLDPQAIELAKLNLLIEALDEKAKLPDITPHLCVGNSLVSGTQEELEKYFGSDYREQRPFNFEDEFKDAFERGGFDVIIGNPPYVFTREVKFQDSFKKYVQENYFKGLESISKSHARQSGKVNLYAIFLIKSINLLKNNGLFGFIMPNNLLRTTTYDIIRKFILDNCKILKIVDLGAGVFERVTASTIILVLEKESDKNKRNSNKTTIYSDINNLSNKKEIEQKDFLENTSYTFNITSGKEDRSLLDKIEKNSVTLGEETKYIIEGIVGNRKTDVVDSPINDKCKKFLVGKDIGKYKIDYKDKYIIYDKKRLHRARPEEVFTSNKIIIQRISGGNMPLTCVLDTGKYYTFASTNLLLLKKNSNFTLEYITALLNSKLINWYYVNKFTNKSVLTVNISKTYLEQIPIKHITNSQQRAITELVNRMLDLNKKLQATSANTDKHNSLKREIEKLDRQIDEEVYKLYGLTKDEIKVIEIL